MMLPLFYVDDLIKAALKEDINYIDPATDYLIEEDQFSQARFMAKADGVLCGLDVALRVFALLDADLKVITQYKKDGERVKAGDVIAVIGLHTRNLLKGERTALNLLQHMSGVATATAKAVQEVEGTGAVITDTRKTMPGMRALQKYAVVTGGGRNHRFNLSDMAMLKDNHLDAGGGISNAVRALRAKAGHALKIEVETRNLEEVREALNAGADIIMLDNMDTETMRKAVEIVGGRSIVEASGGITQAALSSVAETGVDVISVGALTHSVTALDISLKVVKENNE